MSFISKKIGTRGEDIACKYLEKKGYKILYRNFSTKKGEIDIIGEKRGIIIFFEVKTKRNVKFGFPKEYVTLKKQKRILDTAIIYISKNKLWHKIIRFDIVSVILKKGDFKIEHEKDVISFSSIMGSSNSYWQP